jgi:hypothetical protein
VDLDELKRATLPELEAIYAAPRPIELPHGRFFGTVLHRLDNRGAHHPLLRGLEWVGFEALAFGVDFDRRLWFFTRRGIQMGRFMPSIGRSRWRDTDTVRLRYDVSRAPRFVTRGLYDEVKPLSSTLCLGLGGVNAATGFGDHFFFALWTPE